MPLLLNKHPVAQRPDGMFSFGKRGCWGNAPAAFHGLSGAVEALHETVLLRFSNVAPTEILRVPGTMEMLLVPV